MTANAGRLRGILFAIVLWVAFLALGVYTRTTPAFDIAIAAQTYGQFPALAVRLTELGLWPALVKIGVPMLLVATFSLRWRPRIVFSLGALIVAHFASDYFKNFFARARPPHWLGVHETSFGYPSGHAATALSFFALWAFFMIHEDDLGPRPRALIGGACLFLAYGICWSRLALGAHWLTDVIGGGLLGLAIVVTGYAIFGDPAPPLENEEEYASPAFHLEELSESSL